MLQIESDVIREREHDREMLLAALREQGTQSRASQRRRCEPFTAELAHAVHLYLARSATALVALQIEDLLGMTDPVNVPGTDRANIQIGSARSRPIIEDMAARGDLSGALDEINRARQRRLRRIRHEACRLSETTGCRCGLSARRPDPHEAADQNGDGHDFDGLRQREGIRKAPMSKGESASPST